MVRTRPKIVGRGGGTSAARVRLGSSSLGNSGESESPFLSVLVRTRPKIVKRDGGSTFAACQNLPVSYRMPISALLPRRLGHSGRRVRRTRHVSASSFGLVTPYRESWASKCWCVYGVFFLPSICTIAFRQRFCPLHQYKTRSRPPLT